MRTAVLVKALEAVADECARAEVPTDTADRDELWRACMAANAGVMTLAQRIMEAKHAGRWQRRRP